MFPRCQYCGKELTNQRVMFCDSECRESWEDETKGNFIDDIERS